MHAIKSGTHLLWHDAVPHPSWYQVNGPAFPVLQPHFDTAVVWDGWAAIRIVRQLHSPDAILVFGQLCAFPVVEVTDEPRGLGRRRPLAVCRHTIDPIDAKPVVALQATLLQSNWRQKAGAHDFAAWLSKTIGMRVRTSAKSRNDPWASRMAFLVSM